MHWFDHFLTKLSKYLRVKTGDRHNHFVEPCVIDRPFCRMETVYRSHFVEKGVGSLQNGAPQPHPGNGNRDDYTCFSPWQCCQVTAMSLISDGFNVHIINKYMTTHVR